MKSLAKMGKSIIIITHKLNEVMEVADRALVMRLGEKVGDVLVKDTTIKQLSYLMVGRNIPNRIVPKVKVGKTVFETKNLSIVKKDVAILDNVCINVKQGEIVGIAGVSGNGQSELVEAVFGLKKSTNGQVLINGTDVTNTTINNVRKNGVALVPEDRNVHGSAAMASLTENAIMGYYHLDGFSKYGVIDYKAADEFINSLSGGNVQKLILAREINHKSPFLIVSEPTRGVDIGAMEFIHEELVQKRNNGDGVLLISSELTEILDLSDRIYVMFEGQIRGEFTRENASKEKIGFLMLGGTIDGKA
jgi:simple sugar transport system ATP-binding protein